MKKFILFLVFSSLAITSCDTTSVGVTNPKNTQQTKETKDMVEISGKVEDDSGKIAKDVTVVVKEDNKILGIIKTNENGEFSIKVPKVFGDSYFVEATKEVSDGSLNQTLLINSDQKAMFTGDKKLRKTILVAKPAKPVS
ncbi:MAG: hypothetical protein U0457_19035 [Candidatus Sericytochromatia bacterium]